MTATADAPPQRMEFKTELKQLLDLIIHSLYTKKEIFLRELVSNAADAIDKLRFEALKNPELLGEENDFRIRIIPDEKAGTLTVSDNGIGMSRETIVENLGTIAKSGTKAFLENLKNTNSENRPELIGQFGVGFYASFMVADRVTVLSRPATGGADEAVQWKSDGQGEYTVQPAEKASRGTDVILHLREDAKDFLTGWRLREIVKQYSDYIEHPIVLVETKDADGKSETTEQTLNSRTAIWLRPKSEVKEEDYKAFYQQISHDHGGEPLKTIHIVAEGGAVEFRGILYIPPAKGFDWMSGPEKKSAIDLYVRRVLIAHESQEVVPSYLRFVKGVVDALDLPLNVSRETLQHDARLGKIKTNVTNRVLKTLEEMKSSEYDAYLKFYSEFSAYLKEGAAQDWSNRERLADLLLFESTKTPAGEFMTFEKYVANMSSEQKEIYYLIGESRQLIENSPYLEAFKSRGQEVLLLTDPVDEYFVGSLHKYKEKTLKPADRGDVPADKETEEHRKAAGEKLKGLLESLKGQLSSNVKDVRVSARLKDSAAVLVAEEGALSAHMERLMARMGRGEEVPDAKRVLEINPDHPAVESLRKLQENNPSDDRIALYGQLLYDQAVIAEGSRIADPAAFAKRVNDLLTRVAGG